MSHSLARCRLERSNFRVELKDCFVYARQHGTWNSLGRTSAWAIFPRSVVQLFGGIWLAYRYYATTIPIMLWMRMARSESPDTRLLLSLVRRRLALLSIYSAAQRLRDREQSTLCHRRPWLCAVNSYWFAVNYWQGKQKYRCVGSVSYLLVSFVKAQ